VFGSEEAVVHGIANLQHGTGHTLAESCLVANFLEKGDATNEDDLVTESVDLENGTYCSRLT
jgi:hypothetical protein